MAKISKEPSKHAFKPDCKDCSGEHTVWMGSGGPDSHEEICPYCHDEENCNECQRYFEEQISNYESYLMDGGRRKH